jgi:hypothetical protein
MKKCGCTFWTPCNYHNQYMRQDDRLLSSLQIAQHMAKRVNDRGERAVNRTEDYVCLRENIASFVIFVVLLWLIFVACN